MYILLDIHCQKYALNHLSPLTEWVSHTAAFTGVDSFIMRFPSAEDQQVGYETDTITAYTVAENAGRMAYAKLMVNMLRMSPNMVSNMALYNCNSTS